MKKKFLLLALFILLFASPLFAQIPPSWDTQPPRDNDQFKFSVGVSQPLATEQEALNDAWSDAVRHLASSIETRFTGQTDITVQSQFLSSEIEDANIVRIESASFSTNIPITGVRIMDRRINRQNNLITVHLLLAMPMEDYNRAKLYVANEEASSLA